ncbi:MAG: hypothetical protein K9K76_04225 [Halanaerobiales bacterium]|nr:hypothetical protein [Halanaerobiales bacterium]
MIKKKLIYIYVLILLIIPRPVKADLKINIPQNITMEPGELKIIKINIENSALTKQNINPDLELPNNWKLIIPLKRFSIDSKARKNMNILLQAPRKIRSSLYPLNLLIETENKNYKKQIPVKIKEIYSTKIKVVKAPKFIEKEFEIKLNLINKGNIPRHFTMINNNTVTVDKSNIFLNPFESKIISFKGRIKEKADDKIRLNIRAEDNLNKIITLFNDTVIILESDGKFKKYNSSLNFRMVKEKEKYKKIWKLKTSLKKKRFLEIGNNSFNYYQKNKKTSWQFGTEYFDIVKLKESTEENNNAKISLEFAQNKKITNFVYTDFTNEVGVGFFKYLDSNFYAFELKNNKVGRIDYYFNTSIRKDNYQFNYKSSKLNKNKQVNTFFRYAVNKNNNLKVGFNNLNLNKINNKMYLRYYHQEKNKRITLDYNVLKTRGKNTTVWGISRKDIDIIDKYFLYSSLKFHKFENKWKPEFKLILKNNKNKFLIKKEYKKKYNVEYQRKFNYKNSKLKIGINNYGSTKFNINAKNELFINGKDYYFAGKLSYNSNNTLEVKNFTVGISIPFTVKIEDKQRNKVVGKIRGTPKNLGGLILNINGQKVKTKTDGSFTAYIPPSQTVLIKIVDLGRYKGKYLLKEGPPISIENYSKEIIFLDMIKYGNLNLNFKTNNYKNDSYLKFITEDEKQDRGTIVLYNKEHTFFKKFNGDNEINFKNIPPGQYILKVDNNSVKHNYEFEKKNIEISPGKNQITIKKPYYKNQQFKIEKETEKIKINN